MADRIFLSPPHMNGNEMTYIKQAFDSNWIAPLGENVNQLECELASYAKRSFGVATSSGTAAIHLALKYLGVGPGDLVICSDVTFSGTCNPIVYLGAEPVFIDSDEDTWNMSPAALECSLVALSKKNRIPKAAVVVDLYGIPADYRKLMPIFHHYGIPVVEDSAEALGSEYFDDPCGSFGCIGIFSFNANKIITTSGGGMLVADEEEMAQKCFFWATQSREPGNFYLHKEIGYNYRLSNICAGIGRGQMHTLSAYVEKRRDINQIYRVELSDLPLSFEPVFEGAKSNCWLTVVRIENEKISPDDLIAALDKDNIEARRFWNPMHCQPVFSGTQYYSTDKESAGEKLFQNGVCLPSGTAMRESDIQRVISAIHTCFN